MGRAIVVDDAHLIVAQAVDPIFIEKKLCVLNQKVANLRLAEVEHQSSGMPDIGEVEGIAIAALVRLAVEEVEALIAEIAARVVVYHVQDYGESVDVAEIHQCLELVHLAAQIFDPIARSSL